MLFNKIERNVLAVKRTSDKCTYWVSVNAGVPVFALAVLFRVRDERMGKVVFQIAGRCPWGCSASLQRPKEAA